MTRKILSTSSPHDHVYHDYHVYHNGTRLCRPFVGGSTTKTILLPLIPCLLFLALAVDSFSSVGGGVVGGRASPNSVGLFFFTTPSGPFGQTRRTICTTFAIQNDDNEKDDYDDDDEEEEEDLIVDDAALGDWRKFRASLIDGGLPTAQNSVDTTTTTTSTATTTTTAALDTTILEESSKISKRRTVAAQNEALLAKQNQPLAEEYRTGIWAHTIGQAEVGGLLCRMPVEAELYYHGTGYWKDKLDIMVQLEPSSSSPSPSPSPPEDTVDGQSAASSSFSSLGDKEQEPNTNAKVEQ
jgi:hypothetical protein